MTEQEPNVEEFDYLERQLNKMDAVYNVDTYTEEDRVRVEIHQGIPHMIHELMYDNDMYYYDSGIYHGAEEDNIHFVLFVSYELADRNSMLAGETQEEYEEINGVF